MLRSVSDDEEVDDPGGEVQSYVCFTVDHCDTVPVPIAGPGHTTTEQQERRSTHTNTQVQVQFSLPRVKQVTMAYVLHLRNKRLTLKMGGCLHHFQ